MPNVRRPTSNTHSMAGKQRNDDSAPETASVNKQESAPVNKHGLDEANQGQGTDGRNNFGLQDGLHPLQELDTSETTQTQKEQKEEQKEEHEQQQEYYNQYRNPIARLRAQYPQAPAEFLAVRVPCLFDKTQLTFPDFRVSLPRDSCQPINCDFIRVYRQL